ncbi:hypothetical protein DM785_02535 [Deinococcus actinosclerus]|nr:hypothetical protein DM785_02535 [Deinococcus actinosclerus]
MIRAALAGVRLALHDRPVLHDALTFAFWWAVAAAVLALCFLLNDLDVARRAVADPQLLQDWRQGCAGGWTNLCGDLAAADRWAYLFGGAQ